MAHESKDAGTANNSLGSNINEGDEDVKQEEETAKPRQTESDFDVDSRMNDPNSTPLEQGDLPESDLGSWHPSCEGGRTPAIPRCSEETCHEELSRRRPEPTTSNVDLTLKLSPPAPGTGVQEDRNLQAPSAQLEEPSPISSQHSCMSLDLNLNGVLDIDHDQQEIPSLILMGCENCRLYVMVSEINLSCPRCKSCDFLLDYFRGNMPKLMTQS